jgi:hypothetical protein
VIDPNVIIVIVLVIVTVAASQHGPNDGPDSRVRPGEKPRKK